MILSTAIAPGKRLPGAMAGKLICGRACAIVPLVFGMVQVADGITHARHAKRAATLITAGTVAVSTVHPIVLGLAVGAWGAVLVGPDYDLHVNVDQKQMVWRYNKVLGTLWGWYWKPYDWLNGHRGRSHNIPAGTFDRFVMLFWLPLLASCYAAPSLWVLAFWLMVFVGQCMVDAVHLWLDGLI